MSKQQRGITFMLMGDVYRTSKRNYRRILRGIRDGEDIDHVGCRLIAEHPVELTDLDSDEAQDLLDELD